MLILPYSTALKLNQIPYVTFTVIILCFVIFFLQLKNIHDVESAVVNYCGSIQYSNESRVTSPIDTRDKFDSMPWDEQYCIDVIYSMHSLNDLKDWDKFYLEYYHNNDNDDVLLKYIPFDLKRYQEFLATGVPENLDVRLMYYPDTFNPFKMITSTLAHADWSHIIFNLIFFFAFTPTLEILVGNKIKFIAVLLLITFSESIFYSITSFINGSFIPTLGLSGVVTGMIGFSAYMMPHAKIRTLVWFLFYIRRFFVPVWILAIWFIGWDIYDLMSRTDNGGVNLVAHVAGGISGYIIARLWFKARRDDIQDELDDAIELSNSGQGDIRGMMSLHMGDRTRIDSAHRESQAKKDWEHYKDRLHKLVMVGDASNVMLMILDDFESILGSPEICDELFSEIGKWRKKRSYFCVGRLLINLYLEHGKLGNAFTVLLNCIKTDSSFLLADGATVFMMANVAHSKMDHELAYHLIRNYKQRYFDSGSCTEQIVLEAKLLAKHLGRRDDAIKLLKNKIRAVGIYEANTLQQLLDDIS